MSSGCSGDVVIHCLFIEYLVLHLRCIKFYCKNSGVKGNSKIFFKRAKRIAKSSPLTGAGAQLRAAVRGADRSHEAPLFLAVRYVPCPVGSWCACFNLKSEL